MPQRSQMRLRSSGRPGGSSAGCPQREQKRIGLGRPSPAGVHDRSIRIRAVTLGDRNTEASAPPALVRRMHWFGTELRAKPDADNLATPRKRRRMAVQQELWGSETGKAIENFPVSGERVPAPVVRWLGRIKAEAARVNAELGLLDAEVAERMARAGDEVAAGEHDDQFPIDVFQTGSGTSSNMNANEVIANLAGEGVHPNDHVNMGQSSNDVFPSAVHLAAVDSVHDGPAARARARWPARSPRKADEFADAGEGRPHAHDGRRAGDARPGVRRLRRPDPARPRPRARRARRAPSRSRSAAPPPAPGSTRTRSSPSEGARAARAGRGARATASRRRATATGWSSCTERSRSWPCR